MSENSNNIKGDSDKTTYLVEASAVLDSLWSSAGRYRDDPNILTRLNLTSAVDLKPTLVMKEPTN